MTALKCFHCGEPADGEPQITLELDGRTQHFCCRGCQAVCETIRGEGLSGFYDIRTESAVTPRQLSGSELDRIRELDHPLVQQAFVSPVKGGEEAQLLIGGITCAACIWLLENHMKKQPGVLSFTVNHTTQRARLVWAQDQSRLSDLLIAIHELGYTARPYQPDEAEQALRSEHRSMLIRLVLAGIGSFQSMMLAFPLYFEMVNDLSPEFVSFFRWFSLLIATPVVFYSARPFFSNAWRDLKSRHLTMDVPVAIAIGLAYAASAWVTAFGGEEVYFESVCMFTFFLLLGRYIEVQARFRAGLTGNALAGFQPTVATRVQGEQVEVVPAHAIKPGDVIRIRPGETLPIDGEIVHGQSTLNEAALTGEYLPETRMPGDTVHAGSINGENPLDVRVVRAGSQTRLSGIMRVLDRVQAEKPPVALMADRIAGKFVARVLILAPVVWLGWWLAGADNAFDITLSVLVVTCPCALSLATPTAITAATVKLRRLGFLPTRGHTLESMNTIDTVVFDKTGTLTRGELSLVGVKVVGHMDESACLKLAAGLEQHSEHPIARVFHNRASSAVGQVTNHLGGGLSGKLGDQQLYIGHKDFVESCVNLPAPASPGYQGMEIWLASEREWLACFSLDDQPRHDAASAIHSLEGLGIRTLLLSGDRSDHVSQVARAVGIEEAIGQASPEQKLEVLKQLTGEGHKVMMVGDGLNDLPSMAGAGISVAMGSAADLTQLHADAVLLNGQLIQLVEALKTSRLTRRVIRQNLMWALVYNVCALPLAAAGMVPPWLAAIGMSLSSLVVVLNALRLGRTAARPTNRAGTTVGAQAVS
ncbi:heavy metal translocating P-type ATPase [Marinobacter sp. M216]|uniref:Heavy metal translocating P-type ATPase n=1 Tax=Marinobacter albus TaxID=3030833 RepID=A0ABT7HB15_9GAMM|nr:MULTISPECIES: heavy metal translocating P-type ATPase [unclassified Marinobacter]MBW7470193.1 cadmium-translocating P-type ATPase [Marinobacter sp. F4218]MDK9557543.1 heavy metal translocating P-type ATPase [Marinobacter sp. M216]